MVTVKIVSVLSLFDNQTDSSAFLAVDFYTCKSGNADEVDSCRGKVSPCDGNRFNCLIGGASPNRLDLSGAGLSDDPCNRAGK